MRLAGSSVCSKVHRFPGRALSETGQEAKPAWFNNAPFITKFLVHTLLAG